MSRRRGLLAIMIVLGVVAVVAVGLRRSPAPGPLQPTQNVNSFGLPVDQGSTISFVVEFRGEQQVTATLRGVSLAGADPGLALIDAGILVDGYPGTYVDGSFPLGRLAPVAGAIVTTRPGDPTGDVFFNLGIRVDFDRSPLALRGVWLDYEIGGVTYRALLPWLLTVCQNPVTGTCTGIRADQFSFPP